MNLLDDDATGFYSKLGFKYFETFKNDKEILAFMSDSKLMGYGISDEDVMKINI